MTAISVVKLALTLIIALVQYFRNKKMLDQQLAETLIRLLKESDDVLAQARKARDSALAKHDASDGVLDESDPNLRD